MLANDWVPEAVRSKLIDASGALVPGDDSSALAAIGRTALALHRQLPLDELPRLARATGDADLTLSLLVALTPLPTAAEIVAVLAALGEPYDCLVTRAREQFEMDATAEQRKVLERLRDERVISTFTKRYKRDAYTVKLF